MSSRSTLVISASRRTDLVAWFPEVLCDKLERIGPDRIHTLVVWTKDPSNMLRHKRLNEMLSSLDQIFLHLTVTGLGGSELEPGVPPPDAVTEHLPALVRLLGNPQRIRWRFDPILVWECGNEKFSNMDKFPDMAGAFLSNGVTRAITSICLLYPKVRKRFRYHGRFAPVELSTDLRTEIRARISSEASRLGMELSWCCEPGERPAGCIDGKTLSDLHPHSRPAPIDRARGQRDGCSCTRSWDIGWYNEVCRGGCLYCYANPVLTRNRSEGSE